MSHSLKDQLLGLGFKAPSPSQAPAKKPVAKTKPQAKSSLGKSSHTQSKKQSQEEIDLAKAFALRAQQEKRERERAEAAKQEAARLKKLAKEAVSKLLDGNTLNDANAEIVRHFAYGGKIKRIYVTAEQLSALNAGELGVVQNNGRFHLVPAQIALAVRQQIPALLALYCDGTEQALPEGYDDPRFQVPDDLIW